MICVCYFFFISLLRLSLITFFFNFVCVCVCLFACCCILPELTLICPNRHSLYDNTQFTEIAGNLAVQLNAIDVKIEDRATEGATQSPEKTQLKTVLVVIGMAATHHTQPASASSSWIAIKEIPLIILKLPMFFFCSLQTSVWLAACYWYDNNK